MSLFVRFFNEKGLDENKIEGGSAEWVEVLMTKLKFQCRFVSLSVCVYLSLGHPGTVDGPAQEAPR